MKKNQIIVVEGFHDESRIKSVYPNVECIVTNGSEISEETLSLIYRASLINDVVLFLDPDTPGKKITNKILETKGIYKFAYISSEKAKNTQNTKVGVEHASTEDIKSSLENLISLEYNNNKICRNDLSIRKIINSKNSSKIRMYLCQKLNIPFSNGKTLLKYLNMLDIDLERIDNILYEFKY
ncbi:MAG: ribonuclease M5 [Candidatus Izemoplasmatales bacterium]|nr:ribonuclease M5 [Candidatus Izemoplasmatales bacterium]